MNDGASLTYRCMPRSELRTQTFRMRAVQPGHIENIRLWRNAQMDVLRQEVPIAPEEQEAYYAAHVWPAMALERPANILLVLEEGESALGYGGLVHIAWAHKRAELSFLLRPDVAQDEEAYGRCFSVFLDLMKNLAFEYLDFHRLFTETYAMRTHHISILEANGFDREGIMRDHVIIEGKPVDALIHGCLRR
ncbi:GNAT family N-acetyltransferase [Parvibaculum sp.]|uniref:GNAT family N-acetyltransferase n=1 Tax=Parvibaculum sp. TaxID=2024848 RepID=UPI0034A07A50